MKTPKQALVANEMPHYKLRRLEIQGARDAQKKAGKEDADRASVNAMLNALPTTMSFLPKDVLPGSAILIHIESHRDGRLVVYQTNVEDGMNFNRTPCASMPEALALAASLMDPEITYIGC
ncbi:hypothetical protein QTH90_08515 [Variovorax sp. J2P1-59]|uniref:hypothetical protein n=1 Tax=Variovorax flavidus TaxID=3053501 RepID=UPI0025769310|nr:hypothetical protein [Variovorax sp. J2P1-59]MDM0074421.1 hypothetical protein [Variovorax sp. J2P1-59]